MAEIYIIHGKLWQHLPTCLVVQVEQLASCVSVYLGNNSMSFDLYAGYISTLNRSSSKVMVRSQSAQYTVTG